LIRIYRLAVHALREERDQEGGSVRNAGRVCADEQGRVEPAVVLPPARAACSPRAQRAVVT